MSQTLTHTPAHTHSNPKPLPSVTDGAARLGLLGNLPKELPSVSEDLCVHVYVGFQCKASFNLALPTFHCCLQATHNSVWNLSLSFSFLFFSFDTKETTYQLARCWKVAFALLSPKNMIEFSCASSDVSTAKTWDWLWGLFGVKDKTFLFCPCIWGWRRSGCGGWRDVDHLGIELSQSLPGLIGISNIKSCFVILLLLSFLFLLHCSYNTLMRCVRITVHLLQRNFKYERDT